MAQLVVAAAGAALGSFFGPLGTKVGWAIGSIIGSSLGPSQKVAGPRLGDLSAPKLEYGSAVPVIRGRYRTAGVPIWTSPKREIATTTEAGKGGPSVESTVYTYEQDVLYLISENKDQHLQGVSRIWSNGELVWSALPDSDDDSRLASRDTELWTALRTYDGDVAQLPDEVYNPDAGLPYAIANTGRLTIMIESLQLGNSGQIPLLEFETATIEIPAPEVILLLNFEDTLECAASGLTFTAYSATMEAGGAFGKCLYMNEASGGGTTDNRAQSPSSTQWDLGHAGDFDIEGRIRFDSVPETRPKTLIRIAQDDGTSNGKNEYSISQEYDTATGSLAFSAYYPSSFSNTVVMPQVSVPFTTEWIHLRFVRQANVHTLWVTVGSTQESSGGTGTYTTAYRRSASNKIVFVGNSSTIADSIDGAVDAIRIVKGVVYGNDRTLGFTVPNEAPSLAIGLEQYDYAPLDLADEVSWLCERAGLDAADVDVTELAGTTLEGYAVTQVTPVRSVLEMLASSFYFECTESDKLYFRPRGAASAATLAWDDIGAADGGDPPEDRLGLNRGNDTEVPARVSLSYINLDNDYQTGTVNSDRLVGVSNETQSLQLAVTLTPEQAQGIADTIVLDQRVAATTFSPSIVWHTEPRLEPTDVVTLTDEDGNLYRSRIVRETLNGLVRQLECVADDANILSAAGVTESAYTPTLVVRSPANTSFELLDIPILRDADDAPGIYAVMKNAGGKWPGGQLLSSLDAVSFTGVGTVTTSAVFGVVTVALTDYSSGNVFDMSGSVTVDMGSGTLSSSTRDLVLDSEANAMLIGDEVIQFITATLVTTGVYKLTGLLRGRRGTEWAMTGHAVDERAVLLRTAGMVRVAYDAARINVNATYKAVTVGRPIDTGLAEGFTDTGIALKPFAPTGLRADTSVAGIYTVTWDRRTRLSYRWPSASNTPLGEAAESYEVDLLDLTDAVVETQTVTGAAVSFSTATRTMTLDEGIGYLNAISGAYYGIQAEGSGLRYVLKIDSGGTVAATSFALGDVSWCLRVAGGQIFATGDVLSSGTPQTVLSSTIWKLDPADITAVAASYTMPNAGDAHGIWHDGTSLWVPGYVSGDLRELNGTTLASVGTTLLEVGIWAITGDGTYLFITNIDTGDVFAYDPGVGEIWRVTPGSSPFDILVRSGFVYVACADRVVVLNAADGTTVADHAATILSGSFTPALVSFGSYVCFRRTSGYVAFINAGTGAIDFESSIPAMTYLSGADGSTLFTIGSPTLSFTDYQTWGYSLNTSLAGFTVNVHQVSATVGRGYPATITL